MKIAVRLTSGEKRIYEIDDVDLTIEDVVKIVRRDVFSAKTILVECPKFIPFEEFVSRSVA